MNRRGFISSLAGVVAWVKGPKAKTQSLVSPAASAIQPTCEESSYQYRAYFLTRDGYMVEPTIPPMMVTRHDKFSNTIWLDGPVPMDACGRGITIVPVRRNCGEEFMEGGLYYSCNRPHGHDGRCGDESRTINTIPYYQINGNAGAYMGLARS